MKKFISIVFVFGVVLTTGRAAARDFSSSARGTTTADFLKLGVGARAIAMGEAYSAVADDANALYWNPAGLTRVRNYAATFMHAAYLGDTFYDYGAFAKQLGPHSAIGAGVQYFSAGRITQTDLAGTDVGDFTPYDLAASLGYAHEMNGYSVGVVGKFIKSRIINSAQTGAADIGVLTPAYLDNRLRLALGAQNLGGKMKFDQVSERLPMALRMGSVYQISNPWLAALDVTFPIDNNPYAALGTEYRWLASREWPLATRAGYNSLTNSDISGFTGFSFGFGVEHRGLGLDYALLPFGSLGLTHRVSLNLKFGIPESGNILTDR